MTITGTAKIGTDLPVGLDGLRGKLARIATRHNADERYATSDGKGEPVPLDADANLDEALLAAAKEAGGFATLVVAYSGQWVPCAVSNGKDVSLLDIEFADVDVNGVEAHYEAQGMMRLTEAVADLGKRAGMCPRKVANALKEGEGFDLDGNLAHLILTVATDRVGKRLAELHQHMAALLIAHEGLGKFKGDADFLIENSKLAMEHLGEQKGDLATARANAAKVLEAMAGTPDEALAAALDRDHQALPV